LTISPMCDRERDTNLAKSQIGFFQFICIPFYSAIADLVGPNMHSFMQLQDNYRTWRWLKKTNRTLTDVGDLAPGSTPEDLNVRMYDGFDETARRILYPYSDKLSHLAETAVPVHTTILASGQVENDPKPLYLGGVWTRAELEQMDKAEVIDQIEKHSIIMPDKATDDDRVEMLIGKPRDLQLRNRALIAFPQQQSMTAEAAAPHLDVKPFSSFVWRRDDDTFAVAHCWPVKYNDKFRQEFTCSVENPDEKVYQVAAADEMKYSMRRLFGPDADKVSLLYVSRTTHNPRTAMVGKRVSLVKYLAASPELRQQMGIVNVWKDGFVSKIRCKNSSDRLMWFSIPPEGEHVVYVKVGYETMATVKPLELFTQDCEFGPPINPKHSVTEV